MAQPGRYRRLAPAEMRRAIFPQPGGYGARCRIRSLLNCNSIGCFYFVLVLGALATRAWIDAIA
jgi:hypothetical protein